MSAYKLDENDETQIRLKWRIQNWQENDPLNFLHIESPDLICVRVGKVRIIHPSVQWIMNQSP